MRRSLILILASLASVAACSSKSGGSSPPVPRPDDATAAAGRAACQFTRGAMPSDTLGASTPIDGDIPIDNIVVVMMENHSFDSYFGHLNKYAGRTDIESAADGASNVDASGTPQPWTHAQHLCTLDTNHEWAGTHQEIDSGAMDGFARVNDGYDKSALPSTSTDPTLWSGARAMWWYDERDIPLYYQLGKTFAIADHYHCSVPGPTWPNRMYLYAATSFGETDNSFPDVSKFTYPDNPATVLDELAPAGVTFGLYTDGQPSAGIIYETHVISRWGDNPYHPFSQFLADAASGNLPQVSYVDPDSTSEQNKGAGTDEHPPGDIQSGQKFVGQVVQAMMQSPQWAHSAIFIMHDEHGGFYDHVAPPRACAPDATAPILQSGDTTTGGFDMLGARVVMIAVSPYAKPAYTGHHVYDHSSIVRFIETRFKLPALTARDANAEPPTDLFDFTGPPAFATPPAITVPTIDPNELSYCTGTFGSK